MSAPEADPAAGMETEAPPRNDLPRGADRWKPSALHGLDPLRNPSDRREPFAQRKVSHFFSDPTIRKIVGGNVLYLRAVADYADDTDNDSSSSSSWEDLCNEIAPATAYVPVPCPVPFPHPQHPDAPVAKRVSFSAAADVQADAPRQRRRSSSPSSTPPSPPPSPTRRDVEEFLFSMLGDGFNLSMEVIRGVLGNCGYDIKKSMEELMSFSAKDLGKNPVKIIPCSKEPVVRDEDEHQHCYRMDAKQHWDMMKQYFERAANAFKDRDQTYVKYLLEQGKNCYGMARLSEEKSSGEIKSNF